jgi:6-phosphogluconolactonase
MLPADTRIVPDHETVATEAMRLISAAGWSAIHERQVFRLVLAGGTTAQRAYKLLAATVQDWADWEIFWSDERCLPTDNMARNS